jgi:regulator of PEP synthase PpsR (kinase-PPPase family)
MEYAVEHDDGRNADRLEDAEIVLVGVSRTSKTPLSIYLASKGYRTANIPLAYGINPPPQLFELDRRRVFGLTSKADLLTKIRRRRIGDAIAVAPGYANVMDVHEDIDEARKLMRRIGCLVIRTDGRAIEETAQEVICHLEQSFPGDSH